MDQKNTFEEIWQHSEKDRVAGRRQSQGLSAANESSATVGLALSGGGVRSATFSLGVLQALARRRVLECCDYLSTVSGGGYIGSFFGSLFARRPTGEDSAHYPYDTLRAEAAKPAATAAEGKLPRGWQLWWLRNSGRYLAPTGAGDYVYAIAMALRNLVAVHYVLATALLLAAVPLIGLDALVRTALACVPVEAIGQAKWAPGSGLGVLILVQALLAVLPVGFAYFATEMPKSGASRDGRWWLSATRRIFQLVGFLCLIVGVLLLPATSGEKVLLAQYLSVPDFLPARGVLAGVALVAGVTVLLAVVILGCAARSVHAKVSNPGDAMYDANASAAGMMMATRVLLTKWLASTLKLLFLCGACALAVGASGWLVSEAGRQYLGAGGAGAALMLLARGASGSLLGGGGKSSFKLPLGSLMVLFGLLLGLLMVLAWFAFAWGALAVLGGQDVTIASLLAAKAKLWWPLLFLCVIVVVLALGTGYGFQFINLSTIQNLYASRIVRAYLGASNPKRFDSATEDMRWSRISDTHPADNLRLADYYNPANNAPLHIINVTLNETVSPTDPLVQRDRHGRSLAISPAHFCVDGKWVAREDGPPSQALSAAGSASPGFMQQALNDLKAIVGMAVPAQPPEAMALGNWVGISGAAFSTGIGRGTTLGKTLLLGLWNVRLGHWWNAGSLALNDPDAQRVGWLSRKLRAARRTTVRLFQTQAYLLSEFLGRFSGAYARYWYLSDGGHYENTAVYELLRRRVGLIIASDNGADPKYVGEDVANLMRLARIDFGCEFVRITADQLKDRAVAGALAPYVLEDVAAGRGAFAEARCLSIYWVRYPEGGGTALIILKPRLIDRAPPDVRHYARSSPDFPQETTADQFFSEEQWESYRKLGEEIGGLLGLGDGSNPAKAQADLQTLRSEIEAAAVSSRQ